MEYFGLIAAAAAVLGVVFLVMRTGKLVKEGVEATALIVSARSTAQVTGSRPVVEFTLDFTDPHTAEQHHIVVREPLSPLYAPHMQPGMTVPIKFMRNNPKNLMFVHN
ncbi:hypothetical protein GCM10022198_13110 [Klugiella xanthotipulae]|uniref:Uncharacterized protein n=1 Tax=Klugiella xanthotipulae TaxID=244735 RepID=A0A543I473_9MICO|nr:hypothetical protein [Klugiella xanthotipulae]TQM65396.1 hypothetical protein FB466_0198 [Klugiella xanthotipulae]